MASPIPGMHFNRRYLLFAGLLVLAIYVIVPQVGSFHVSWHLLSHPNSSWVALAIMLAFFTYIAAAGTYYFLSFKPLSYGELVLVQLAAMFINKLLPAGIGALGANYSYLRHKGHNVAQAATVVAINNLIGFLGHIFVIAATFLVFSGQVMGSYFWRNWSRGRIVEVVALTSAILIVVSLVFGKRRFKRILNELKQQFLSYRSRPWSLLGALSTSICLTLANVLCLCSCALALGVHISFVEALIVFSFGLGAGAAIPTPGGLGGFEAGLFGGLVAYHVGAPSALAVALMYRLITYWLPLVAGSTAFIVTQRKKMFTAV